MSRYMALIVDFGGVLTTSITTSLVQFCASAGVSPERLKEVLRGAYSEGETPSAALGHMVADLETGRMSPDEFEPLLAEALSDGLPVPLEAKGLIGRMFQSVGPDERMLEAVGAARKHGLKTAVLSNTWGRSVFFPDQFKAFDAVVLSEHEGVRKPEPEIYLIAAKKLGERPEACVFVDDVPRNVEGARAVGMAGVLHKDAVITIPKLEELFGVSLSGEQPRATKEDR
ncbi:MAG TPA: HAD family phosphatase [Actinomycetota bacterium]|nr:HAD family phosphatase [Actinomycetota bacterium]